MDTQDSSGQIKSLPKIITAITIVLLISLVAWGGFLINKNIQNKKVNKSGVYDTTYSNISSESGVDNFYSGKLESHPGGPMTDVDPDLIAQSVTTIGENKTFHLKNYPGTDFILKRIALGSGGAPVPFCTCYTGICDSEAKFISVKVNSQPNSCVSVKNYDGMIPAVLFVSFEISNNSGESVGGEFVQVLYKNIVNGKEVTRKAQMNPPWAAFNVDAFSERTLPMGFIIPEGQEEVTIIYGNYADKYSNHYGNDFERTEGGFLLNLKNKTVVNTPG